MLKRVGDIVAIVLAGFAIAVAALVGVVLMAAVAVQS